MADDIDEKNETAADEAAESPSEQQQEEQDGTEMHEAKVPEQFQKEVAALIGECKNPHMCDYIRTALMDHEQEMSKNAVEEEETEKSATPASYSMEDAPVD